MKHVALLRGINVGRNKRIAMGSLRALMHRLGFPDASTVLASGNVVFTGGAQPPERLERRIEGGIVTEFGMSVSVLVRTRDELAAVAKRNPFAEAAAGGARHHVAFLSEAPPPEVVRALDPAAFEPDEYRFAGREIYLWYPNGLGQSTLDKRFWGAITVTSTTRNWNTVMKLLRAVEA